MNDSYCYKRREWNLLMNFFCSKLTRVFFMNVFIWNQCIAIFIFSYCDSFEEILPDNSLSFLFSQPFALPFGGKEKLHLHRFFTRSDEDEKIFYSSLCSKWFIRCKIQWSCFCVDCRMIFIRNRRMDVFSSDFTLEKTVNMHSCFSLSIIQTWRSWVRGNVYHPNHKISCSIYHWS